jgi:cytochrome P450
MTWVGISRRPDGLPLGPRGLPVLGSLPMFQRDALAFLLACYHRYGDVVAFRLLRSPVVAFFGPEPVRRMLVLSDEMAEKAASPKFERFTRIGGRGIVTTAGEEHRLHRKIVQRAFAAPSIRAYQAITRDVARAMLARWKPGDEIDLVTEIVRMGQMIASGVFFGMDVSGDPSGFGEAMTLAASTLDSASAALASSFLPWDVPGLSRSGSVRRSLRVIRSWVERVDRKEKEIDERCVCRNLLDIGRSESERWGVDEVLGNLIQLYMTGYDTTTWSMVWTLYLLAQHPDVCRKLLDELGSRLQADEPEHDELAGLEYLDAVSKESLRLYPTGPYGFRFAVTEFEIDGARVPQGAQLLYSPYVTHRCRALFPAPETFDPERFRAGRTYPPGAYIPFGMGLRSCVGAGLATMQIKTLVPMILRRFRLDVVPGQELRAISIDALHLEPGLRVRVAEQDGDTARSRADVHGNVVGAVPRAARGRNRPS